MFNFLNNIGPTEMVLIAVVLIAIFGAAFVTKLGKTSGETFREIKKIKKTFKEAVEDDDKSGKASA
jgi:Sec-independent protein translocase protein TatA